MIPVFVLQHSIDLPDFVWQLKMNKSHTTAPPEGNILLQSRGEVPPDTQSSCLWVTFGASRSGLIPSQHSATCSRASCFISGRLAFLLRDMEPSLLHRAVRGNSLSHPGTALEQQPEQSKPDSKGSFYRSISPSGRPKSRKLSHCSGIGRDAGSRGENFSSSVSIGLYPVMLYPSGTLASRQTVWLWH